MTIETQLVYVLNTKHIVETYSYEQHGGSKETLAYSYYFQEVASIYIQYIYIYIFENLFAFKTPKPTRCFSFPTGFV